DPSQFLQPGERFKGRGGCLRRHAAPFALQQCWRVTSGWHRVFDWPHRRPAHHQQDAADLRQQRQQDEAKHGKVVARRPQHSIGNPGHDLDRRLRLRIRRLPDRHHGGIEELAAFGNRGFAFAAELADALPAFPVARRHGIAQGGLRRRHRR
ncbi:hypothetical protein KXV85_005837, partial [Aspergillus fumigatus]